VSERETSQANSKTQQLRRTFFKLTVQVGWRTGASCWRHIWRTAIDNGSGASAGHETVPCAQTALARYFTVGSFGAGFQIFALMTWGIAYASAVKLRRMGRTSTCVSWYGKERCKLFGIEMAFWSHVK
jgi:hypothetical protein